MPENHIATKLGARLSIKAVSEQLWNDADRTLHSCRKMEITKIGKLTGINEDALSFSPAGERADRTGRIDRCLTATDCSAVERMHAKIRNRSEQDAGAFTDGHAAWPVGKRVGRVIVGDADLSLPLAILEVGGQAIVQCICDLRQYGPNAKREPR